MGPNRSSVEKALFMESSSPVASSARASYERYLGEEQGRESRVLGAGGGFMVIMRSCVFDVRVSHDDSGEWLVWLDAMVVGRFESPLDALPYASLLECSPRAREEAKGAGSRSSTAPR